MACNPLTFGAGVSLCGLYSLLFGVFQSVLQSSRGEMSFWLSGGFKHLVSQACVVSSKHPR